MAAEMKEEPVISGKLAMDLHRPKNRLNPDVVSYQFYSPQQHSTNQTKWIIDSPGRGYLLDAFALVKYKMKIQVKASVIAGAAAAVDNLKQMFARTGALNALAANGTPAVPALNIGQAAADAGYGTGSNIRTKLALRQNFPMCRCIQTATLGLNGYQIVEQPYLHIDALNRIMMSKLDSWDYATMSAGYFDEGDHSLSCDSLQVQDTMLVKELGGAYNQDDFLFTPQVTKGYGQITGYPQTAANYAAGSAIVPTFQAVGAGIGRTQGQSARFNFVVDAENANEGFGRRLARMASLSFAESTNVTRDLTQMHDAPSRAVAQSITFELYEPIPVSPFAFYPSEGLNRCIPNVDRMTLQYNYVGNILPSLLVGYQPAAAARAAQDLDFEVVFDQDPELRLRWFRPPFEVPPQLSLSTRRFMSFQTNVPYDRPNAARNTNAQVGSITYGGVTTGTAHFNNIRFDQMPDMLLIYFKHSVLDPVLTDPSDFNLAIESLQIELDGITAAINANSADLYRIWLSNSPNGCKSSYNEWFKRHCVLALRPDDLGVQVSRRGPVSMHLRNIKWADFWTHPVTGNQEACAERGDFRSGTNYILYVQAVYENRELTLTRDGMGQERIG